MTGFFTEPSGTDLEKVLKRFQAASVPVQKGELGHTAQQLQGGSSMLVLLS